MLKKLNSETKGFTIIEVLIVLAIAGLIMMIVFLAVPALQRNSRNTQRRNDVQKMLGVLQEAANNNNGILPSGTTAPGVMLNERYTQYTSASINYNVVASGAGASIPATIDLNTVIVRNNYKCGTTFNTGSNTASTAGATTTSGASIRSHVAVYAVELQSGTIQVQCVES